jgi:hypothetical protein
MEVPKMSLTGDPIAVVLLPPGMKADEVKVDVLYEQGTTDPWSAAQELGHATGRNFRVIEQKKYKRDATPTALVVESD